MEKKVEFKVGKDMLRGSLFIPKGKGPFSSVIFFHGSGSTGETYFEAAKKLADNGILGFAFNFRSCGVSDGKFEDQTIGMGADDAKAALDFFLAQKKVDKERIGISGSSFGGFWASTLSSKYKFKSIILIAPAAYSPSILNKKHVDFKDELRQNYRESSSYKEIEKFNGKLLVVRVEFEDILSPDMVDNYLKSAKNASRKEEYLLKGARHQISKNPEVKEVLVNKICDWFLETL